MASALVLFKLSTYFRIQATTRTGNWKSSRRTTIVGSHLRGWMYLLATIRYSVWTNSFNATDPSNVTNLTNLSLGPDGGLKKLSAVSVIAGPVAMTTYNNKSTLVLAHIYTLLSVSNTNMIVRLLCVPDNSTAFSRRSLSSPSTPISHLQLSKTSHSRHQSISIKPLLILRRNT